MKKGITAVWIGAMCVLMALTVSGCGKKGDPRPAGIPKFGPAAPMKLEKKPGAVTVSWPQAKGQGQVAVYKLERSESSLKDKYCLTCPQTFSVIASVDAAGPMCRQGDSAECAYTDPQVREGYRYLYRLKACDPDDRCDAFSQPAKIDY